MNDVIVTTYEASKTTEFNHDYVPRFGKPNNFASLFAEEDVRNDYILGLIFAGAIIISLFLFWSTTLIIFKCIGDKVGFLSGLPFTYPYTREEEIQYEKYRYNNNSSSRSNDDFHENVNNNHPEQHQQDVIYTIKPYRRPIWSRRIFMLSGFILICFGVLLVTMGITNIRDTVLTISVNNEEISTIAGEASAIASSLRGIGQSALRVRDELAANIGNFCPAEGTAVQLQEQTGINFDKLASDAVDLLNQLGDFINGDVIEFQQTLDETQDVIDKVDNVNDQIQLNDWQALLVLIPIIVIPSFLMVGCVMAMYETTSPLYTKFLNWICMPLFVVITFGSYVGSGAVAIASTVNSDWCTGGGDGTTTTQSSPDGTVLEILDTAGLQENDFAYRIVKFYTSQCLADDPWSFLELYEDELVNANKTVTEFFVSLEEVTVPRLTELCGRDFSPFEQLLKVMIDNLRILLRSSQSALSLIRCDRIVPIYVNLVYDGTCNYSVTGITWIWVSLLVIALCCHIMLTLRSSMYETQYSERQRERSTAIDPADVALPAVIGNHHQQPQHIYHVSDGNTSSHDAIIYAQAQRERQYATAAAAAGGATAGAASSDYSNNYNQSSNNSEPKFYADEQHRQYAHEQEEVYVNDDGDDPEVTFPTNFVDDGEEQEVAFPSREEEEAPEITYSRSSSSYHDTQQYGYDNSGGYDEQHITSAQEVTINNDEPQPSAPPQEAEVVDVVDGDFYYR